MAASSIPNLFSFFAPSKPPSAPPSHLSLPSSATTTTTTTKDRWSPLVCSSKEIQPNTLSLLSSCPSDVMSVVCPSLACANTFFFSSKYNVQIVVEDDEAEEQMVNRFRREVARAGILQECRRRMFHENAQDKKKRKRQDANRRIFRRRQQANFFNEDRDEMLNKNDEDDNGEDNWDLPEGEIPYWGGR